MKQCLSLLLILAWWLPGCAAYVATSGRVAVKDDRPASRAERPAAVRPAARDERVALAAGFSSRDRQVIAEHFEKPRPAGSARREALPAGFAVQQRLPASILGQPLPAALESRLTVLPDAYVRLQVGRDVLLMERQTRIVLDLLREVVPE